MCFFLLKMAGGGIELQDVEVFRWCDRDELGRRWRVVLVVFGRPLGVAPTKMGGDDAECRVGRVRLRSLGLR